MLKAPLLGFSGLISVSILEKKVAKYSRYSFAILLNLGQELQASMEILESLVLLGPDPPLPFLAAWSSSVFFFFFPFGSSFTSST